MQYGMFFYIASLPVLHSSPSPFQTHTRALPSELDSYLLMFSMPGTVAGGKWIIGAVSTSNMFWINMFSFCWYLESENLLLDVLFSSPKQLLLSWKHYLLKGIFQVSGIQSPVSSLTLIPSFLKPKKSLMSMVSRLGSPHL